MFITVTGGGDLEVAHLDLSNESLAAFSDLLASFINKNARATDVQFSMSCTWQTPQESEKLVDALGVFILVIAQMTESKQGLP